MLAITLPDGSMRQFDAAMQGTMVAKAIGPRPARAAVATKLDGKAFDIGKVIAASPIAAPSRR